jgi:hypothetical protein
MSRFLLSWALAAVLLVPRAAVGADRTLSVSGTVTRIDAKAHSIAVVTEEGPERTFVWTPETRITGTMTVGSRVSIRYLAAEDGRNVAVQITVNRS